MFKALPLLILLALFGVASCSDSDTQQAPNESGSPESEEQLTMDSDPRLWREFLAYRCDPEAPAQAAPRKSLSQACSAKIQSQFQVTLPMKWECRQSDRSQFKRPLPYKAEIPITVSINNQQGVPRFLVNDINPWKSFLNPALEGETNYRLCRLSASRDFMGKLEDAVEAFAKTQCSETVEMTFFDRTNDRFNPVENAGHSQFQFNDMWNQFKEIHQLHWNKEARTDTIPSLIPYYQEIDGWSEIVNSSKCHETGMDRAAGNKDIYHKPSGAYFLSKHYLDNFFEKDFKTIGISENCKRNIMLHITREQLVPDQCNEDPNQGLCPQYLDRFRQFYQHMDQILAPPAGVSLTQVITDRKNSRLKTYLKNFHQHKPVEFIPFKPTRICEKLAVGESRNVFSKHIAHDDEFRIYRMTRVSDKQIELLINVSFKPTCEFGSDEFKARNLALHWLEKANACLSDYNPDLKGLDGTAVHLKLISKSHYRYPINRNIKVIKDARDIRENSGTYSPTTNCATIVHEVLHLTGLVDEYEETAETWVDPITGEEKPIDYRCRRLGPSDSIMNNQYQAIESFEKGTNSSLLKPAHYRFMVFPGCDSKNTIYNRCGQHFQSGPICSNDIPAACDDGVFDWINL